MLFLLDKIGSDSGSGLMTGEITAISGPNVRK